MKETQSQRGLRLLLFRLLQLPEKWKRYEVRLSLQLRCGHANGCNAESHILIHAFLISQNLPKTANALVKELSRADPALEYDVVEESGSKSGAEIMGMVRARLELEKNS